MVGLMEFVVPTQADTDYINITRKVEQLVESSGIRSGTAFIITAHTTTGITVNEALECLQSDMRGIIAALAPEMRKYSHARMLHSYGQSADNAPSHIRAMLTNNHAVFPVKNGKLHRGKAQDLFLAEFDGPQDRRVVVVILGDEAPTCQERTNEVVS